MSEFYSSASSEDNEYSIKKEGTPGITNYRVFVTHNDHIISPFHNIPLWVKKSSVAHMVVEIPRGTQAKMEINKKEQFNPIAQDIKEGKLRFIACPYPHHYGTFPQTWENPAYLDPYTNAKGDNDPVDVYDISSFSTETGDVIQVKILGVYGMIDAGETDWKVIAINVNDPDAKKYNDISDIPKEQLDAFFTFMRDYKIPEGKGQNKFAFDSQPMNKAFAIKIINETHEEWKKLIKGETNCNDISLTRF